MKILVLTLLLLQTLATDIGLIAYFQSQCPQGWESYIAANKRFILSEGGSYSIGDTGGMQTVTLSVSQIPSHSHDIPTYARTGGGTTARTADSGGGRTSTGVTFDTGGNQPHQNMPPYIVLKACKKVNATQLNCSQLSTSCDTQRFFTIENQLTQKAKKITQLEASLAQKQLDIYSLQDDAITFQNTNIQLNASIQAVKIRITGLENQQGYDNKAELGLAIAATVLSALALIIEICYIVCHFRRY